MAVKNLNDLFEHELKDIYYAEHRLLKALEELASEAQDREMKRAYTSHKRETQGQIKRLQKVFKMFGKAPEVEKCPGIEGLLKEKHDFKKKEKPTPQILEFFNLGAAAKTERYEITAYESLINIAGRIGLPDAVELLGQNLAEEQAALEKLITMARQYDVTPFMKSQDDESERDSSKKGSASKSSRNGTTKNKASKGAVKKSGTSRTSKTESE